MSKTDDKFGIKKSLNYNNRKTCIDFSILHRILIQFKKEFATDEKIDEYFNKVCSIQSVREKKTRCR